MKQLEEAGGLTRDDRCDLPNLETDGGVDSWEAANSSKSRIQGGALNLSIDHADNWNNVSFGNLLALVHAAGAVENAPAHTPFSSQNADGSSVSSRISFDLNYPPPPGRDAASSSNSFQFAPITPVQNKGRQSKVNLNLNLNEIPILEEDVQENVEESDLQGNKEQSVPVRELSEMMENHRPDKTVAEANKTPQTKPRRKKPRPKVVVEGQAKRANKPELTEVNISYDLRNHEIGSISQQAHNVNATSQFEVLHGAQTNAALQSPKYLQPLNTDVLKRKRSKGFTRACDLVSLHEICKQFPTYSSREAAAKQHTGHLNTCMEALAADARPTMKMKKRSKRNSLNGM
nr:protein ROS1-like [Ipomoea batatas]